MAVAIHPGGSTHVNTTISGDDHHQPTNAADSFFDLLRYGDVSHDFCKVT